MTGLEKLSAPFDPKKISWRVGSTTKDKTKGMALAYIDARDVMERLDSVCGIGGWQCSYPHADKKTICEISIFIDGQWISKADGAGDSDIEAEKGAISDAFKRAAVKWGVGRYLYDLDSPWVELEARGNSFAIPKREMDRLASLLSNKVVKSKVDPQAPNLSAPTKPRAEAKAMPDHIFEAHRMDIGAAGTMEELKALFTRGYNEASSCGDNPAMVGLTKVKDIRKKELESELSNV